MRGFSQEIGAELAEIDATDFDALRRLLPGIRHGMTLVTHDLKSMPSLLRAWGAMSRSHGGVVFVDHKTILANDIGGQVRSLVYLWDIRGHEDWTNVVDYLSPAPANVEY